jgi:3-isopropylmalate/(R)-2-methylmalate dehydratase small subunit
MSMKAWKVGNNIDTDLIIAARYLNDASDENMKAHCMEDVIPDYANTIAAGDVLVAGSNFGCGSSREHAPISIKVAGTSCVIAESFARIFYRNAINIGLPIIESPEAAKAIDQGDELDINFEEGIIQNLTKNENYHFEKFPEFIQQLVVAGNLLNYVKAKVNK